MLRVFLLIAMMVAAIGGLWFWLKPDPQPVTAIATADAVLEARYVVSGGKLAAGPKGVAVQQGTRVRVVIESDRADELHLHGYDLHLDLEPGVAATLAFTAETAGRFELELHGQHLSLGYLVVTPP